MKNILNQIISCDEIHAKWVNTIAHLEYIGARKIIKTLDSDSISLGELQHFAEEARHAYFLKKIGSKNFSQFPRTFKKENLLGGFAGKDYFQNLDGQISDELKCKLTRLNYLYVTWLIEERVMKVYSLYNNLLLKNKSSFNITSLITEEIHHLEETTAILHKLDPNFKENSEKFLKIENKLFSLLWSTISDEVLLKPNEASLHA